MSELRRAVAWVFAIVALVSMWLAVSFVRQILSVARPSTIFPLKSVLLVASLPAVFAALAIILGAAAWTVLTRKSSARNWGIAASLVQLLVGINSFYWGHRTPVTIAVGIVGLIAFSRRDASPPVETFNNRLPISGDGTNAFINKLVGVVGSVAWFAGMSWWYHWANSKDLHFTGGTLIYLVQILLTAVLVIVLHELGHAAAGMALGMKIKSLAVGPFQCRIRDGRWKFQFLPKAFLSLSGATGVVPVNPQEPHSKKISMIAAGPLTNLFTGLLALYVTATVPGRPWEPAWHLLALFTTISLVVGALNLVPFQIAASYSDGAQIYQILSGGPWADYHRAISIASSSLVTSLRPRDYDIEAIQRAAGRIAQGTRGLHLPLLASTYYFDCGRYPEAIHELNKAEAIYRESAPAIPVEWHYEFIFGKALLQRDAAGARLWWERVEAKKPDPNWDYWRSRSALLWIENHQEEACEAWSIGNELVQQLPNAGANEFHKYTFLALRQALDGYAPTAP